MHRVIIDGFRRIDERRRLWFLGIGMASAAILTAAVAPPFDPSQFFVDSQIAISRWAAEPDVVDPVSICFDEFGRAYVAECRDYPYGAGPDGQAGSTIRLLTDTNADGLPDRASIFADKLSYATSVTPWRGGVFVAAAPDILYLKDTDNDGVADVREVMLKGFKRGVSDALVNGLRYGLDGRIHGLNGGNDGMIFSPRWQGLDLAEGPIDLRDHDFSFHPDTGSFELTTRSAGGFGMVFDSWGRAFVTHNINHLQHCHLPRKYAERHPRLPTDRLTVSISDHGEMSRIFPIGEAQTRPNHPEQAGFFSAAGGMGYVDCPLWPADLRGSIFVCDVVGNLVHRDLIHETPGGFVAARDVKELDHEFLASRDPHFRPVGLENGPDGALYLLAMQRAVIEHPDYIPAAQRAQRDLRAGSDLGRIYRLAPVAGLPPVKVNLGRLKNVELVPFLGHANSWWRYTAQRLLIDRRAVDALAPLRALSRDSQSPLGRLHALWTLNGIGNLGAPELQTALEDGHPGIRENALRLVEPFLAQNRSLLGKTLVLLRDPNPMVRYQAILTIGATTGESSLESLLGYLVNFAGDFRIRSAVLASLDPSQLDKVLQFLTHERTTALISNGPVVTVFREVADLIGARADLRSADFENALKTMDLAISETNRIAILQGLGSGMERSGARPRLSLALANTLTTLAGRSPAARRPLVWQLCRTIGIPDPRPLLALLPATRASVTNRNLAITNRLAQIQLLAFDPEATGTTALLACLDGTELPEIQKASLGALRQRPDPTLGSSLLIHWRALAPDLRDAAISLLLSRPQHYVDLITSWETGSLTIGEFNLDLEQRRQLLRRSPPALAARTKALLGDGEYGNRAKIVEEWLPKLPAAGDVVAGQKVFEQDCAKCHRSGNVGRNVGPELTSLTHRSVEDLLANILDPNMALSPGYVAYLAETSNGESQTGLLNSQNPTSITLLQADEQSVIIPRTKLSKLESTGRSLMPEGLEQGKSPQNLRDLIAFLQARK